MDTKSFLDVVTRCGIDLPDGFAQPKWDPIPALKVWNANYGPRSDEGYPHWDGNAVLVGNQWIELTILLSEHGVGAERAVVKVWDSGVISLEFTFRGATQPMQAIRSGDELRGMLRVLRVLHTTD